MISGYDFLKATAILEGQLSIIHDESKKSAIVTRAPFL